MATSSPPPSLPNLQDLKKLKKLYLWQTKVTDAGVAKLQKALPQVEINRGQDLLKVEEKKPETKAKDDKGKGKDTKAKDAKAKAKDDKAKAEAKEQRRQSQGRSQS